MRADGWTPTARDRGWVICVSPGPFAAGCAHHVLVLCLHFNSTRIETQCQKQVVHLMSLDFRLTAASAASPTIVLSIWYGLPPALGCARVPVYKGNIHYTTDGEYRII
jgi:hypothetical protein